MRAKIRYLSIEITPPGDFTLSSPDAVTNYFSETDWEPHQESIYVLALSSGLRVCKKEICKGGLTKVDVTPSAIFRFVMLAGCEKFILVHNHPSLNNSPSDEDVRLTSRIERGGKILGLTLVDHIIVSRGTNPFSFRREGLMGNEA